MSSLSHIETLAGAIDRNVGKLSDYLRTNTLPFPSFSVDAPIDLGIESRDVEQARVDAISKCSELLDLLQGPQMCVRPCVRFETLESELCAEVKRSTMQRAFTPSTSMILPQTSLSQAPYPLPILLDNVVSMSLTSVVSFGLPSSTTAASTSQHLASSHIPLLLSSLLPTIT